jgi:hypothetical protein
LPCAYDNAKNEHHKDSSQSNDQRLVPAGKLLELVSRRGRLCDDRLIL